MVFNSIANVRIEQVYVGGISYVDRWKAPPFVVIISQAESPTICARTEKMNSSVVIQTTENLEKVAFGNGDEYANRDGGDDERTT